MTSREALYVIKRLPSDLYYEGNNKAAREVSIDLGELAGNYSKYSDPQLAQTLLEEIYNYLLTLDFDPVLLTNILNEEGDCDCISIIKEDGSLEASGDDRDYVVFTGDDFYIWTEVLGITYSLKDYDKTWTYSKHIPTADELRRDEEFSKSLREIMCKAMDKILPELCTNDLVEVKPVGGNNNDK